MLLDMAKQAKTDRERTIFLHYTWGRWGEIYDEYHICIDENGDIYRPKRSFDESIDHRGSRF